MKDKLYGDAFIVERNIKATLPAVSLVFLTSSLNSPSIREPSMTETPTSDIDLLMSLDPLQLTKADLTAIITYHRNLRAEREAGKGRAARAANALKVKLDLAKLGLVKTPQGGSVIKRRV